MRRVPIRLELTLAFAGVMAVVLAAIGAFLYLSFERDLSASVDRGLRSRAADVAALVREAGAGLAESAPSPLVEQEESFAQVVEPDGRVVDASPQLPGRSLLDRSDLARARRGTITVDRDQLFEAGEPVRLLATPVSAPGSRLVAIVGASLDDNEEALGNLLALLLIGGPAALLLASIAGYGVAAAALRPVEAMRRRAAEIGERERGRRLPVPPADDEIARLGETLNAMLDRLDAAFDRERTFVSDASHELRTPLAVLKAELELALRQGRSREQLVEALGSAAEETDRLAQLAEDLLVIARHDCGRLPVRLAPVDAGDLLENVRRRFAGRGERDGRLLEVDEGLDTKLIADRLRVEQALGNVVDNALRHGRGRVRLSAAEKDGFVELRVSDEGEGFPEGFIDEAFERFTRADGARGRGGAGLGLAIVDAVARAHGGTAAARNRSGGGTDVWLELPREGR